MLIFICIIFSLFLGYKLRKAIELVALTRQVKFINITVDKILSKKINILSKFNDDEDLKAYLKFKKVEAEK